MRIFLAVFAVLAGLVPASAADVFSAKDSRGTAAVAPFATTEASQSWSGLWGAALAGYSITNTELGFDERNKAGGWDRAATVDGFGGEGFSGAAQIGFDMQAGRLVFGPFVEYSFGGSQSEVRLHGAPTVGLDVEQKNSLAIMGRVGVLATDNTLIYAAAGWSRTEVELSAVGQDETIDGDHRSKDVDFDGLAAELGVETRFSGNLYGRLAGRYTWYDTETLLGGRENGGERLTGEPGELKIQAGIVYKIGGGLGSLTGR